MKLRQLKESPSTYFSMGMDAYEPEITDPEEELPILGKLTPEQKEDFLDGWHQAQFEDPNPRGEDSVCPTCGQST